MWKVNLPQKGYARDLTPENRDREHTANKQQTQQLRQAQPIPNLNAGNTVSNRNNNQPLNTDNVSWDTEQPPKVTQIEETNSMHEEQSKTVNLLRQTATQQNNQPVTAITTAAVANDNSKQTTKENNIPQRKQGDQAS